MSADNWTICPMCLRRAEGLRDGFREKYYGKLEPKVFVLIFKEIERAVEHINSYSADEFECDEQILALAEKNNICVEYEDEKYDSIEIHNHKSNYSLHKQAHL